MQHGCVERLGSRLDFWLHAKTRCRPEFGRRQGRARPPDPQRADVVDAVLHEAVRVFGLEIALDADRNTLMAREFDGINASYRDANKRSIFYEAVLDAAIEELWDDGEVQVLRLRGEGFVAVHIACEPAIRSAYLAAATEAQAATDPDSGIRVIYGEQIDRLEVVNRNKAITRFRDELQAGCPIR